MVSLGAEEAHGSTTLVGVAVDMDASVVVEGLPDSSQAIIVMSSAMAATDMTANLDTRPNDWNFRNKWNPLSAIS